MGQNLTQDELLLACGGLLWGFNCKRKIDPKTGLAIDPNIDKGNSLLIIKPDPFEMQFEPRSEKKLERILSQWKTAEAKNEADKAAFLEASKAARMSEKA